MTRKRFAPLKWKKLCRTKFGIKQLSFFRPYGSEHSASPSGCPTKRLMHTPTAWGWSKWRGQGRREWQNIYETVEKSDWKEDLNEKWRVLEEDTGFFRLPTFSGVVMFWQSGRKHHFDRDFIQNCYQRNENEFDSLVLLCRTLYFLYCCRYWFFASIGKEHKEIYTLRLPSALSFQKRNEQKICAAQSLLAQMKSTSLSSWESQNFVLIDFRG